MQEKPQIEKIFKSKKFEETKEKSNKKRGRSRKDAIAAKQKGEMPGQDIQSDKEAGEVTLGAKYGSKVKNNSEPEEKFHVIDLKNSPEDNNQGGIGAKAANAPIDLRETAKRGTQGTGNFINSDFNEISEELLKPYLGENIFEPDKTEELINETVNDYNSGSLKIKKIVDLTSALRIKMAKQGYSGEQRDVAVGQLLEKIDTKNNKKIINSDITKETNQERETDFEFSRKATDITLARIDNYKDLRAKTGQEGEKKFINQTRKAWKEFVVHGVIGADKKTGKKTILNYTDLDGKSSMALLKLAGINTKDVEYVAPGEFVKGKINLDTGGRHGLVVEDDGKTVFMDHHADESGEDTSATKVVYEVINSLGLLKKEKHLDKLVEFVTQIDNCTYPDEEKYFKNSHKTILGLQRFIHIKHLLNFFKADRNPTEILQDSELKKMGLFRRSQTQKKAAESSLAELKKMETDGLIIPSDRYGKIAVDIGKKVKAGSDAAKAYGCGAYIIWSPKEKSFFISVKDELTDDFSQGKKIRNKMWIKPRNDEASLGVKLEEILNKMTDGKFQPVAELKEYMEKEAVDGNEKIPVEFESPEQSGIKKEKENVWVMELSENQAEQERINKLFKYILERARKVDIYDGIGEKALRQIAINQTKESYNKHK